jgi:flavin reductase (DIM6/NTAB) family NADH-FMN oxidoreductase RutF
MDEVLQIAPGDLSAQELQTYLQAAVAPRPIAFASTIGKDGNVNLSPFSFFNIFSANPPILIFSPSRRVKDNSTKHTLENILEIPEVSINMVNYEMAERMSFASNDFPRGVNEFEAAGFASCKSMKIKPPCVAESPVSFECLVDQVIPLGNEGGAGNLVLARIVYIHIRKNILDNSGRLCPEKMDLIARMGGDLYCRVSPQSLFELKKPG